MRKRIIISCIFWMGILSTFVQAQTDKLRIAVFDPASSGGIIDEGMAIAAREIISSALVNTGKYNIVERSLLDKILKEQKFSNSGAVDESQISELGRLVGANKAILTVLTSAGKRVVLSVKMVGIESANVESQKIKTIAPDELLDVIEPLTLELIGEAVPVSTPESGGKGIVGNITSIFGSKRSNDTPKVSDAPKVREENRSRKSDKERFAERSEEKTLFASEQVEGKKILLAFKGSKNRKNPIAQLYIDGRKIGEGTLNQGFHVEHTDTRPGTHTLKIEWSGTVATATFDINTNVKQHYEFEYKAGGFGYAFKMIE